MNTMELTKIFGAIFGALLIYLLVNWAGETIYHVETAAHGDDHGDDHGTKAKSAFLIEIEEEGSAAGAGEEGPSFEELLALADADKGSKVFSKCKACHKLENGANGTGPHLFNLLDRDIGVIDGFAYSTILTELPGDWVAAELDKFLANPKKYAPGTKMSFSGLKKATDRANLIAYLEGIK